MLPHYHMKRNNVSIPPPYFMSKEKDKENIQPHRDRTPKSPVAGERSSSRLKEVPRRDYSETIPRHQDTSGRSHSSSSAQSPTPGCSHSSPPPQVSSQHSLIAAGGSRSCTTAPSASKRKCGGRTPDKIPTIDEIIIGLPHFGEKSVMELEKTRMDMKMYTIHQDCKAHIRRCTKGNEYLSIKQWNSYAKRVCDVYPNLKNEGNNYWELFKIGLQKSFSAERKNKKKRLEKEETTAESVVEDEGLDASTLNKHPLDIEAENAIKELKAGSCNRSAIKSLLEKSVSHRKIEREALTPAELFGLYPFLKIPEMMIFDYLLTIQVTIEDCERIFEENVVLLGAHFQIDSTTESDKLNIMLQVHEYFVSKAVKKGLKPVFIVKEEDRQSMQEMVSSEVQAPFLVVLKRQNFVTGLHEVRRATLLMSNTVISSLVSPTVDKIMLLLLGAYLTLNSEYPSPYQQFMRGLEKLVTGKAQPSKYGRSQVAYDRLMSLIKKK